jgi:hypothetical protein
MKVGYIIVLGLMLMLSPMVSAQKSEQPILSNFDLMLEKANRYRGHKVVPIEALDDFRATTQKALVTKDNSSMADARQIDSLILANNNLTQKMDQQQTELSLVQQRENHIRFMFWHMTKTQYNVISWSLILGLMSFLLGSIWRQRSRARKTKDTAEKLKEVTLEFEQHRQRVLEREQVLRRKLQDEINKQKTS